MFKSLASLIPGFDISHDNLPKSNLNFPIITDECLLIEDSNACSGEFLICSLLELYLRDSKNGIVFIASVNSFDHYAAVLKKLV